MLSSSNIARFFRNEDGATATYVALMAPVLIGFVALGTEVTGWRMAQSKLQHVADVTAFSGAVSLGASGTATAVNTTIADVGVSSGATIGELTGSGILLTGTNIPAACSTVDPNCVKVTVTRTLDRFYSRYFSDSATIDISASAIAVTMPGDTLSNCVYATTLIDLSGSSTLDIPGCYGYAKNTSLTGHAEVTNGCLLDSNASEYGECTSVKAEQNTDEILALKNSWVPDPTEYADRPECPSSGEISPATTFVKDGYTIPYCVLPEGGITGDMQLAPGLYIVPALPKQNGFGVYRINGNVNMTVSTSPIGYEGVTFLLEQDADVELSGTIVFGTSDVPVSAPTDPTNPLYGRFIIGAPTSHLDMQGTADLYGEGIIYMAGASTITLTGNSVAGEQSKCLAIATDTLELDGNGLVSIDGACAIEKFGTSYISTTVIPGGARLVQ